MLRRRRVLLLTHRPDLLHLPALPVNEWNSSMSKRPDLNAISAGRIARADYIPKPSPGGSDLFGKSDVYLSGTSGSGDVDELRAAGRMVVRMEVFGSHVCAGLACIAAEHAGAVVNATRSLQALGLAPDVSAPNKSYAWGRKPAAEAS